MLIAKAMGADFAYHWDETEYPALDQQTTASVAAVFDADFRRHCLPGLPDLSLPTLNRPLQDASAVASARADGDASGRLLLRRPYDLDTIFFRPGPVSF